VPIPDEEQQQIRQLLAVLREVEGWMDQGLPGIQSGSPFGGDDAETHPHEVSQAVAHALTIAVDHLHCMRMALTGERPDLIGLHTHAPFTLLRASLENASTAVWLAGPSSRRERILRRLRLEMKNIDEIERMLKAAGTAEPQAMQDRRRQVHELAAARQIDPPEIAELPTYSEIVKDAGLTTELHDADHNLAFLFWKMCSAFAHGDRWTIGLLDLEVLGQTSPGVSSVRITAPTESVVAGTRGALFMVRAARQLWYERAQSYL
jgi:hypothetical protein